MAEYCTITVQNFEGLNFSVFEKASQLSSFMGIPQTTSLYVDQSEGGVSGMRLKV